MNWGHTKAGTADIKNYLSVYNKCLRGSMEEGIDKPVVFKSEMGNTRRREFM